MKYRNRFDYNGQCSDSGYSAENLFSEMAEKRGWEVSKADRKQQLSHVDVYLNHKKHGTVSFDVKAQKKVKRTDSNTNDKYLWVEFSNVAGKEGWLRGNADLIAFEQEKNFLIVRRQALLDFCEKNVDFSDKVDKSSEAVYRVYQRKGRKDEISLIPIKDIKEHVSYSLWKKP